MAITRLTTWIDGQILTAGALNAEFDNIINAAGDLTLLNPLTTNLDFNGNQALDLKLESNPGGTNTMVAGRVSFFPSQGFLLLETSSTGSGTLLLLPPYGNSRVDGLRGSLSSNTATFAVDHGYMLERSQQPPAQQSRAPLVQCNATSAFSIDTQTTMTATGFGGRDQTSGFASTAIHYYAVTSGVHSTTVYGVCSCQAPPIGPTAVLYWAYLCSAIYTPASSVIPADLTVRGSLVQYNTPQTIINAAGFAATLTSAATALGTRVPPIASNVIITASYEATNGVTNGPVDATFSIATASSGLPVRRGQLYQDGNYATLISSASAKQSYGDYTLPVIGSVPVMYYTNQSPEAGSTSLLTVQLQGYTVPNGDV